MKNLKKVLALAVAFVMCFTMYAGAVMTFTDVPVGGDYSEAISFLTDLQVIAGKPDGTFGVNDAITRADAACLIARMMTGQMNPPKYDNHVVFSDVEVGSYYESSVGYCAALGITSGTGNGQFSPKRTITDGEFVAMVTRALGYDTAEAPLSYPMGNIVVAQAKGLLDGVNIDYMTDALRGEDAQILYNAVFADYDREARNKNIYQNADDHYTITIAEAVYDLGRLSHDADFRRSNDGFEMGFHGANKNVIYDCDVHTWVIAGVDARAKENTYVAYAVDDDDVKAVGPTEARPWAYQEFTYEGDIKNLLGYRVELWGEMDHSNAPWEVSAIKVLDGQSAYDYNAGMYTDDNQVKIEDKTLKINKSNNQTNLANIVLWSHDSSKRNWGTEDDGVVAKAVDGTTAGLAARNLGYAYTLANVDAKTGPATSTQNLIHLNFEDGDQYKLIDWDSDDYIDFVVRETYKYGEVTSVTSTRVVIEAEDSQTGARGEYALKLDDDNLVVTGADGLAEGDIVEISVTSRVYSRADDEVVTINLSKISSETKKLEKINLTKDIYTFDGEEVTLASPDLFDLVEEDDTRDEMRTAENIGQDFQLWYDRSGFILKGVISDDSARGYLMILAVADGSSTLRPNAARSYPVADVLFDDNSVGEEVVCVKDLRIDGWNDGRTGYNSSTRVWTQERVVGNVYKYYMNDDGEITRLEEQTLNQYSDYNFDESKDRLGVADVNPLGTAFTNNYGFADDAVIFAVRRTTKAANIEVTGGVTTFEGYINRSFDPQYVGGNRSVRYWVDPDDVMAVSVDDVPEIDNRWDTTGGGAWRTPAYEVTHPATFLNDAIALNVGQNIDAFAEPAEDPNAWPARQESNIAGRVNGWMNRVAISNSAWNTGDRGITDAVQGTVAAGQTGAGQRSVLPSVAIHTDKRDDVDVAIFGVDSLNFFGASTVKLALITNVYALGNKTYGVEAAIDGKYEEFKTVSDDESDIFRGRINSLTDMQSYLNLEQDLYATVNGDPFRGSRNGLYAEVTMDSEGLIKQIRAMDVVDPLSLTAGNSGTYWGDDRTGVNVRAVFMEGNVYRVIRGVTTQLLSKNLVTWQTSPTASSGSTLYSMDKNADNNGYDHLEAAYDENTFFYDIDQLPRMFTDVRTFIDQGFRDDVDEKIKPADSSVLQASTFIDMGDSSDFYLCDYAVYKNDMDRLAAVFAFKESTNEGVMNTLAGNLTVNDTQAATEISNQQLLVTCNKTKDAVGGVDSDTVLKLHLKRTEADGTETEGDFVFYGLDSAESVTLERIRQRLLSDSTVILDGFTVAGFAPNDTLGQVDTWFTDIEVANGVLTIEALRGEKLEMSQDVNEPDSGYEFTVTEVPESDTARDAISSLTVRNGVYTLPLSTTITFKAVRGGRLLAEQSVVIPAGTYTSVEIAREIADRLDNFAGSAVNPANWAIQGGANARPSLPTIINPGTQNMVFITDATGGFTGNLELTVTIR